MDDPEVTPDEWEPSLLEGPHDHKGYSEEKCIRCGWVMGNRPLNCNNDDTPHRFPSQEDEIERLRALIAEWVDAWDEGGVDAVRDGSIHRITVRRVDAGHALRKEVRRG